MAANHTQNYALNLWEPTDQFLRAEFNENSQKLDTALKAEEDARAALAQTVAGKADAAALAALTQTVSGKADADALEMETATRTARDAALQVAIAAKADASAMNAALNQKADASALTALSQTVSALLQPTPLLDFTTAANTDLIAVPITDEYRQPYRRLLLYYDLKITAERSADVVIRKANGELVDFRTSIYPVMASTASEQAAFSRLILELAAPAVFFHNYSYRKSGSTTDRFDNYCSIPGLTWNQVSNIEFKAWTNSSFAAGGRIQLYGLL